ncbi:GDSL-type esterase/lipase family protein [Mucilaginibacter lacusdianchii]|uniref:GDSL-type esterase/lipase family protein n=1 Tax=Mucilaginibacter lacusdianchii TaxID=2684211 RepID=UPI00131D27A3|nr:GDSL-type esterase/lipase family protein [Mucilaginibacter sp. JXJ CY 39]
MKRLLLLFSFITGFVAVAFAQQKPAFYDDIQKFKAKDSLNAPAKGGILFVGSSSFTMWSELENVFKNYGAINRGFGGSTLAQANYYIKDIVYPYQARQIVIYSGENDIASDGVSAIEVLNRFATFFTNIRNNQPDVPVIYISIKQSPSRAKFGATILHVNALIKEYLTHYKATRFIDVDSKMHNPDGSLRPELFRPDMLHMQPAGYSIWIKELTPYLLKK